MERGERSNLKCLKSLTRFSLEGLTERRADGHDAKLTDLCISRGRDKGSRNGGRRPDKHVVFSEWPYPYTGDPVKGRL